MKAITRFMPIILSASLAALAPRATAQGTLLFANRVPAFGIDAPVTSLGQPSFPWLPVTPVGPVQGPRYLAQLAVNGALVGRPQPFATGASAGYVAATDVAVPGVVAGASVSVSMVAWDTEMGATYSDALAKGWGGTGMSFPLEVRIPASGSAPLTGLQPFSLTVFIPEPAPGMLGLLGAACLMLRRARS